MKITAWAILFTLLLSTPALARLGESMDKCRLRYGSPVRGPAEQDNGTLLAEYEWQIYNLAIIFTDGKATRITYELQDGGPISMRRIEDLLSENPSQKLTGSLIGSVNTWYIGSMYREKNRIYFHHKGNLASSYYDVVRRMLVIRLISQ